MTSVKTILISLVLLAGVASTTGCDPDEGRWVGPRRAGDPGPRTAVLADSLVDLNDAFWQRSRLAHEGPIAINSISRTGYRDHREWIRRLQPVPDRAIVAVGTNNAWQLAPQGWQADDERDFVDLVGTIRARGIGCIVVTAIGHHPNAGGGLPADAARANAFLASFVSDDQRGDLRLADWAGTSRGRADYFADDVHHTEAGVQAYYALLATTVRTCGP